MLLKEETLGRVTGIWSLGIYKEVWAAVLKCNIQWGSHGEGEESATLKEVKDSSSRQVGKNISG
jgi:hypothetical protein